MASHYIDRITGVRPYPSKGPGFQARTTGTRVPWADFPSDHFVSRVTIRSRRMASVLQGPLLVTVVPSRTMHEGVSSVGHS
jgi:hypothetical protein